MTGDCRQLACDGLHWKLGPSALWLAVRRCGAISSPCFISRRSGCNAWRVRSLRGAAPSLYAKRIGRAVWLRYGRLTYHFMLRGGAIANRAVSGGCEWDRLLRVKRSNRVAIAKQSQRRKPPEPAHAHGAGTRARGLSNSCPWGRRSGGG